MSPTTAVTFKHILRVEDVRECCIHYGWYTAGTVDNYNNMFEAVKYADKFGIDATDVRDIATDILIHSDTDNLEWGRTLYEIVYTLSTKIKTSVVERNIQ